MVSLSIALTALFFSPAEIYFGSMGDFPIGAEHILIPMLILSAAAAAVVFVLILVCLLINQKLFNIVVCIVFGVCCAFYAQELFWNGRMQLVTADAERYDKITVFNYVNFFSFYATAFVPLALYCVKDKVKTKSFGFLDRTALSAAAGIILLMQLIGTGSNVFSLHKVDSTQYAEYLSIKPTLSFSKDMNIIIFVVDRFDGRWMETVTEDYPEINDEFDGFTFYHDNTSRYCQTYPAIAHLITGKEYDGTSEYSFLSKAWSEYNTVDILKENGFRTNYLIECASAYNATKNLRGKCDNLVDSECDYNINYIDRNGIVPIMTRLSIARIMPYFFKSFGADYVSSDFPNYFIKLDAGFQSLSDHMSLSVVPESDLKIYDYFKNNEFNSEADSKVLTFIHLIGAHDISAQLSALSESTNGRGVDQYTTLRGDFEIIFYYLEKMKELGVYDDSTIIITGDHGRPPATASSDYKIDDFITTALLIKPENSRGVLKNDYTAQLSHSYFEASLLEYAGIDHSQFGYSYNDVIKDHIELTRYVSLQSWGDTDYEVNGKASDFNNWTCTHMQKDRWYN